MLQQIFLKLLDMSIAAGYCAVFVIIIRLFMKKLPKSYSYVLWAVVFIRLMVPGLPETTWSLLPKTGINSVEHVADAWQENEQAPDAWQANEQEKGIAEQDKDTQGNGAGTPSENVWDNMENANDGTLASNGANLPSIENESQDASAGKQQITVFEVLSWIWLAGTVLLLVYGFGSNILLKKRLKGAKQEEEGSYELENLPTAFVIGIMKPRIFLPAGLAEEYRRYVLAHEQTHISRGDIWVKHITYFLTCIHWFNPLVWISYRLMCRDMEMSCDERVLRTLGVEEKKAYSMALLSVASGRKLQLGMPVAFSENDAKSRIQNVLNYRRPAFWAVVLVVVVLAGLAVGLLSDPVSEQATDSNEYLREEEVLFDRTPILKNDLKDRAVLAEKLSQGFNVAFLLHEYEDVNELNMGSFRAVLFDYADIENYSDDTVYYFDGQNLMEQFCIMTGQDEEEFLLAHSEPEYNTGKQYHTVDGDDKHVTITVEGTEWNEDSSEVKIYYQCWDPSGYHLWDGTVTMRPDAHYLKFVSNIKEWKTAVETVASENVTTVRKNAEAAGVLDRYLFTEDMFEDIAKKVTGNSEVFTNTNMVQYDGENFYGIIECSKPNPQFTDLYVIYVQYSVADGTVKTLAEIPLNGPTTVSGVDLYRNSLYWYIRDLSGDIDTVTEMYYRYDLVKEELTEIQSADWPQELNSGNLTDGCKDNNGYWMYTDAENRDRIWLQNLENGEKVEIFDEKNSGSRRYGVCEDKFYILDDIYGDTALEIIDFGNNRHVVYDVPEDIGSGIYVSGEYLIFDEAGGYTSVLNINKAVENME